MDERAGALAVATPFRQSDQPMIFARIVRQFHGDREAVALAKDFPFVSAPTMGARIEIAGEAPRPLSVVSITLRPRPAVTGALPPGIVVFLEWEALADAAAARERGWRPIE